MSNNANQNLMARSKVNTVSTLRTLANAIEAGDIENYNISQTSDGAITVKADSADGTQRMIQERVDIGGYSRTSTEHIEKQSLKNRRKTVRKLAKLGMSQTKIAEKTMVSQKTVSNDIAFLKQKGKL